MMIDILSKWITKWRKIDITKTKTFNHHFYYGILMFWILHDPEIDL